MKLIISTLLLVLAISTVHGGGYTYGPVVTGEDFARVAHILGALSAPKYGYGYGHHHHHSGPVILGYPKKAILTDEWHTVSGGYEHHDHHNYGGHTDYHHGHHGGHHGHQYAPAVYSAPAYYHHGYDSHY